MSMHKNEEDEPSKDQGTAEQSRRDFLKGSGVVAGGLAAAAAPGLVSAAEAQQQDTTSESKNPYGPRPGGGISLPEYYRPWPAIKNRNFYAPGTETLPKKPSVVVRIGPGGCRFLRYSLSGSAQHPPDGATDPLLNPLHPF